ncbi:MAG: hypothetical protein OEU32_11060 [Acidimicrobiia bacterium]|nr:hypothetical protein [Acidimicrobiia bacterium]
MSYPDDRSPPARPPASSAPAYDAPQVEALLRRVADLIEAARPMPLSASSMINKEEVLEILNEALAVLPDELRAARWLLKEREEFLARVRREGDEILDMARARSERMVQRTEVVKASDSRARQIIDNAEAEARRIRLEVEDYCDQKLGSFEIILDRTRQVVEQGRQRLQGNPLDTIGAGENQNLGAEGMLDPAVDDPGGFFDQDIDER